MPLVNREVDETDRLYDLDTGSRIYVKLFAPKYFGNDGKAKRTGRPYDSVHSCFYCGDVFTNIHTHLTRFHKKEPEVKEIIELKAAAEEEEEREQILSVIRHKQTLLRNAGDNLHNLKVVKCKQGELLIYRRGDKFRCSEFGPCPYCLAWLSLETSAMRHQAKCPAVLLSDLKLMKKGSLIYNSNMIKGKVTLGNKKFKKAVFPRMRRDNITDIAQQDELIVGLGEEWFLKACDNRLRRDGYSSFHMRQMARLLMKLREISGHMTQSLSEYLVPKYFDTVAEAALLCCTVDNADELEHPSTAIKLGFDVARVANTKLCLCLKTGDQEKKQETLDFLQLMRMRWSFLVTKLARVALQGKRQERQLPSPTDLAKLTQWLITHLKNTDLTDVSPETFRKISIYTLARLMTYNKRRSGEVESFT